MVAALIFLALLFAPSMAWAAFPVQASVAQSQEDTATTTHDITMPSGITAGDLLVADIDLINISNADPTVSGLTGWTQVCAAINSDTSTGTAKEIWRKFASGSETNTTYTTSVSVESHTRVSRYTGAHASTPPECAIAEFDFNNYPNTPSLTVSWPLEDTRWESRFGKYNAGHTVTAYPTDYTADQYATAGGANNCCQVAVAARNLAATTENPGGWSLDGVQNGVGATIAIRPASGAAASAEEGEPLFFH